MSPSRVSCLAIFVAGLLCGLTPAGAAPSYTLTLISSPDAYGINLVALNNPGIAVGSASLNSSFTPVKWQNGKLQVISGLSLTPIAINNRGIVLGSAVTDYTCFGRWLCTSTVEFGSFDGITVNARKFNSGYLGYGAGGTGVHPGPTIFDDSSQALFDTLCNPCFDLNRVQYTETTQLDLSFANYPVDTKAVLYDNITGATPSTTGHLFAGVVAGRFFGGTVAACNGKICGNVYATTGSGLLSVDLTKKFGTIPLAAAATPGPLLFNGNVHFAGSGWLLAKNTLTSWSVPGQHFIAYAMNIHDHIAGLSYDANGVTHAFVWSPTGVTEIGSWPSGVVVSINGFNQSGTLLLGTIEHETKNSYIATCAGSGC